MRPGITISSVAHVAVVGWGLVIFAVTPLEAPPTEAMPVDLVPLSEITQLKAGTLKQPPKPEEKKQVAEKVAEPTPVREPEAKPAEKPEVKPTAAVPPPPPPPQDSLPDLIDRMVKPESTPSPQPVRVPEPPKRPPIPKQVQKPETPAEARTPQRTFDPGRVAALLDKRTPTRAPAAAEEPTRQATLGVPTGLAQTLTQSEIDALRAQIQACWNPPVGAEKAEQLIVRLRIQFKLDGTLSREPELMNRSTAPYFQVAAESAMRAVRRCAPYTMPAAKYEIWKDVEVTFDPRDMFRG